MNKNSYKFAYAIIKDRDLVTVGYADSVKQLEKIIIACSDDNNLLYNGMGCYGFVIQTKKYDMLYWKSEQNGFADIRDIMNMSYEQLNCNGMIKSHMEED